MALSAPPFKKRSDPFNEEAQEVKNEEVVKVVEKKEEVVVPAQPKIQPQPTVKVVKKVVEDDADREKYTATMDKSLRKRIKIAAAMDGIQVSSFIEQACLEKLEREGK